MNTELIQLEEVVKRFGKNAVLEGVNLSIPENKITGIIGASGEGKSTILKLIIGYYKPTHGRVTFLKRNIYNDLNHVNKTFGFATEDGSFYGNLTVKENLYHFGYLYNMKRDEVKFRADELLDFVGLSHAKKTRAKYLSVGMKKRLDLACALMHVPEVLIMDEPTADLDPLLRKQILSMIRKIRDSGTTIILTTQILEEMDDLCDKIAILHDRQIVEEGPPDKIRRKYGMKSLNGVFEKIFSGKVKGRTKGYNKSELASLEREREKLRDQIEMERRRLEGRDE
jgi:ABC-2 type transport system ATP-binding protein